MALSREQYEQLMREYSVRRDNRRRETEERRRRIYAELPAYRLLDEQIPALSMKSLTDHFAGGGEDSLPERLQEIAAQKRALLRSHGYPEDYLEPACDCPDCHDTGYVDGRKCHCLRQRELRILYQQSHLEQLLKTNRFELLSTEYYKGEDLQHFQSALESCRLFVKEFGNVPHNLFFYGSPGTGKSFLSISTAGEILQRGCSVLYFSASGLFETISSYVFVPERKAASREFLEDLYSCDLLLIDDLGTELTNSFIVSQLFALITERAIRQKAVIISTNLTLSRLREQYSDRIFSRITSGYTVHRLTGPDIRLEMRMKGLRSSRQTGSTS